VNERGAFWSNSLAIAGSRALLGVVKTGTLLLIARHVPVSDFGQLTLAFAVVEVVRQLADGGLETVAVRVLARTPQERRGQVLGTTLALKLGLAGIGYLALLPAVGLLYGGTGVLEIVAIVGLLMITGAVSSAIAVYFQARLRMERFVWTSLTGGLSALLIVLALAATVPAGLRLLAAALVLGDAIAAALAMVALGRPALAVSTATARALLTVAWPVALTQVLVVAYFRLDVLMLTWLTDLQSVGLYGVATRLTEPLLLVPAAIAASLYGAASPLWEQAGGEEADRLYRVMLVSAVGYGVLVALALTTLGPSLLAWALPRYVESIPPLRILAWALVFMSANMVTTAVLNSMGRFRLVTAVAAATLVFCAVANLLLVPWLGIQGAALATVLTEAWNSALQIGLVIGLRRRARAPVL
jgi:O-antigen/teichoic acid export membrane protein